MNLRLDVLTLLLTIVALPAIAPAETASNQLTDSESRSGWQLLFDGKSADGWRNYNKDRISDGWEVTDGAMVRSGKGAGDIVTNETYGQFELSLEYKISKGGIGKKIRF